MNEKHIWQRAKGVRLQTGEAICGGFDIGFDGAIPEESKQELRRFVAWVESSFYLPITLWVDFEYRHYLLRRDRKRVGYLFYWADFSDYPRFERAEDIPIIRLPVRTERSTMDEILSSFIEALSCYFAYLLNEMHEGYAPNEAEVGEILRAYRQWREKAHKAGNEQAGSQK